MKVTSNPNVTNSEVVQLNMVIPTQRFDSPAIPKKERRLSKDESMLSIGDFSCVVMSLDLGATNEQLEFIEHAIATGSFPNTEQGVKDALAQHQSVSIVPDYKDSPSNLPRLKEGPAVTSNSTLYEESTQ